MTKPSCPSKCEIGAVININRETRKMCLGFKHKFDVMVREQIDNV